MITKILRDIGICEDAYTRIWLVFNKLLFRYPTI